MSENSRDVRDTPNKQTCKIKCAKSLWVDNGTKKNELIHKFFKCSAVRNEFKKPFLFCLTPWSIVKSIRFISYYLIFIAFQESYKINDNKRLSKRILLQLFFSMCHSFLSIYNYFISWKSRIYMHADRLYFYK